MKLWIAEPFLPKRDELIATDSIRVVIERRMALGWEHMAVLSPQQGDWVRVAFEQKVNTDPWFGDAEPLKRKYVIEVGNGTMDEVDGARRLA